MTKKVSPYGFWESPLTADQLAKKTGGKSNLSFFGDRLYFCESRPAEAGRTQVVSVAVDTNGNSVGEPTNHLPPDFSASSGVHEYGGSPFCVNNQGIYFCNAWDQQIYFCNHQTSEISQVTHSEDHRFADLQYDQTNNRLVAVAERWTDNPMPDNYLIGIALEENTFPISSSSLVVLHEGHDFYACPRISPDGQQIAFVCWDMPDMPWDRTLLYLAPNKDLSQKTATAIVNTAHQAAMQPTWGADNTLYFINDPEGWWQLYKWQDNTPVQVFQVNGEIGLPMWVFGQQSYAVLANEQDATNQAGSVEIVFSYADKGIWKLGSWSEQSGVTQLSTEASSFDYFVSDSRGTHCHVQCSYPDKSGDIAVISADGVAGNIFKATTLPAYAVSKAIPISIPVAGESNADKTTHAFLYPPNNDAYQAPENSLPPLIVIGHGGPSGQSTLSLNEQIQFWTTRGFAVADVNYRGSTGFGRAYRESLYGQWGVYDVADCVAVANYLVAENKVHPQQLIIRGKSAGGYSVLAALCFHDVFTIGSVHYGISDLTMLAEDTHKFEARYLDKLIAPYPEGKQIYIDRSPINHLSQMNNPVIVFQGLLDKVVPPSQAEAIVDALKDKGIDVEYVTFADEKHGFRQAENIKKAFTEELKFYLKHIS